MQWMTIAEYCSRYSLSRHTVRSWILRGKAAKNKIRKSGHIVLVREDAFAEFRK